MSSSYQIDPTTEQLLAYPAIIEWFKKRTGRAPHRCGVRRWIRTGVRGIPLPSVLVGGIRYSTPGAIGWWINATSQASAPEGGANGPAPAGVITPHQRRILERAGVMEAGQ
jgi:hypothetical protein